VSRYQRRASFQELRCRPRPKWQAGLLLCPEMISDEWNSLRLQARRRCLPAAELLLTMSRPPIRRHGWDGSWTLYLDISGFWLSAWF
jgi:hypothetical protein